MVLVGGDCSELGLREDESLEVLRQRHVLGLRVDVDGVKTRLIFVHRVQYYLHISIIQHDKLKRLAYNNTATYVQIT